MKNKSYVALWAVASLGLFAGMANFVEGWVVKPGKITYTRGKVGIGVTNPSSTLEVLGNRLDTIWGENTKGRGVRSGITGITRSKQGDGVYGGATASRGVATGVTGLTNSRIQGYGMFSFGDIGATGAKLFVIDHPFDPEHKLLNHYAIEAPEPFTFYRGSIELDENGEGAVVMPDYFEAINKDYHYQLTPIGFPSPNLHIASVINDGVFWIAGGVPFSNVSWSVSATRDDPYMRAYQKPTVQDKLEGWDGKYLQPELYNKSDSEGIRSDFTKRKTVGQ